LNGIVGHLLIDEHRYQSKFADVQLTDENYTQHLQAIPTALSSEALVNIRIVLESLLRGYVMTTPTSLLPEDYIQIENEHKQLNRFLSDLHDTCCSLDNELDCKSCTREKVASCRGRFPSFLYRMLETTGTHYNHEESIMLARPNITEKNEYFRAHHQAHSDIIKAVKIIAEECKALEQQALTAEGYRLMHQKISTLFEEHDRSFDTPFIQSTYL
jgi:hemerythrin